MRDKTESVASRYFGRIICQSSPNIIVNQMKGNKTTQGQKLYLENPTAFLVNQLYPNGHTEHIEEQVIKRR